MTPATLKVFLLRIMYALNSVDDGAERAGSSGMPLDTVVRKSSDGSSKSGAAPKRIPPPRHVGAVLADCMRASANFSFATGKVNMRWRGCSLSSSPNGPARKSSSVKTSGLGDP